MKMPLAGVVPDGNLDSCLVSYVLRRLEINIIVNTLAMIS